MERRGVNDRAWRMRHLRGARSVAIRLGSMRAYTSTDARRRHIRSFFSRGVDDQCGPHETGRDGASDLKGYGPQ